jgi:hypothetical protein
MNQGKLDKVLFLVIRWVARIIGSLMALFVVIMVVAYSIQGGEDAPSLIVAAAFASLVIGVILAWIWEGIGGGFLLLSSIVFIIFQPNAFWPLTLLVIFPITAILFLICWLRFRTKPEIS